MVAAGRRGRMYQRIFRQYKAQHAVTWIETLKKREDWNSPEPPQGGQQHTEGSEELLKEATKYYEWLFGEKRTEKKARRKFIAELRKRQTNKRGQQTM